MILRQGAAALCCLVIPAAAQTPAISAIDRVWSAHPVQFGLAADERQIVVAYYDAERQLTVASRSRAKGAAWRYQKLPSRTGWDSHNYLAVAIDRAGQIHVTGNMHNDPLVYFRSESPGDVRSMRAVPALVDRALERRMTYPIFPKTGDGRLVLKYRDGGSGNGNEIYNIYDEAAGRWAPLLTTPLADGESKRNAYFVGPVRGPDGRFHLTWVWRETPDAATNHDLSYAVSSDLVSWRRSDGTPITLPIRLGTSEIVDPVPVRGGIINNNTIIGFDSAGRAMIAYHKYDGAGRTQMFVARGEGVARRTGERMEGFPLGFRRRRIAGLPTDDRKRRGAGDRRGAGAGPPRRRAAGPDPGRAHASADRRARDRTRSAFRIHRASPGHAAEQRFGGRCRDRLGDAAAEPRQAA